MRAFYSHWVCSSNNNKIFTKCIQPMQRCLRKGNLRNSGLFTSPKIIQRWSYNFRVFPTQIFGIILPRSVGFYIETLSIYLGILGKLTLKTAIAKMFKWSKANNWFLLLFNFIYDISFLLYEMLWSSMYFVWL